jgi:hypothetical protein
VSEVDDEEVPEDVYEFTLYIARLAEMANSSKVPPERKIMALLYVASSLVFDQCKNGDHEEYHRLMSANIESMLKYPEDAAKANRLIRREFLGQRDN